MLRNLCLSALFVCGLLAAPALAYEVSQPTFAQQYDVVSLDGDPELERTLLGELDNAPEMYEIISDHDFVLTAEIRAVPGSATVPDFTGIIVRQKEGLGVEEVARMAASDASWAPVGDSPTGLVYQSGPFFSEKVPAGTYRIEVSTPLNTGKYMLVLGNTPVENGYFATLAAIHMVYEFYGLGTLSMFHSPYVHYPVGCLVIICLIAGTWYYERRRKHHA